MKISISREENFNAAHRLNVSEWSEDENKSFFGLCNNPNYHGHNYKLIVSVFGEVDPVSGYLIDIKILKNIIEEEVIEQFDHRNLNLDIEDFKNINPTAENIAFVIWNKINNRLGNKYELKVKLYETPRNFVEYNGK